MIYDCFQFFNEFDTLEIRLEELYPVVDKFVICESTLTHSNKPNELKFKANLDRYSKYLDKITYIVYDKFPEDIGYWTLENDQRRYLINGIDMENLKDEDVIMISDVDEIPKRSILNRLIKSINIDTAISIGHQLFYGKLTNKVVSPEMHKNWGGTVIVPGKLFKQIPDMQYHRNNKDIYTKITNSGSWHFSYMGCTENIKHKIQSFCHSEWDQQDVLDNIAKNVEDVKDPLGRPEFILQKVEVDNSYPEAIKNNPEKYKLLIG